eukprot:gene9188-1275_t
MWVYFDNLNDEKYCKKRVDAKNLKVDSYWKCFFRPLTNCELTDEEIQNAVEFRNQRDIDKSRVVFMHSIVEPSDGFISHKTKFFYKNWIYSELRSKLQEQHNNSDVWFLGILLKYLIQPNKYLTTMLEKVKKKIGFKSGTVGLHIRRTDKVETGESKFLPLSQYMKKIENYFKNYSKEKIVFVATDDSTEVEILKSSYSRIKFISNLNSKHPNDWIHFRYTSNELLRVLIDVYLLSECDLFVGTFSSHISRLVFELIQSRNERNQKVISIDSEWYNGMGVDSNYPKKSI